MIFYNFYTDRDKTNLVYRTIEGWSKFQQDLKMFDKLEEAHSDFFKLLWDNEDFRQGTYSDTDKKKKDQKKKSEEPAKENKDYEKLPSDFSLDLNKVYNLDCLLFMEQIPKGYVDYSLYSPPYNVGMRVSFGKNNAIYKGDENLYQEYEDELTNAEYEAWLFKVIDETIRISKKHVFMNIQMLGNNKLTIMEIFNKYRHQIKDVIIWNKTIASPHINKQIMNSAFEFIFIFSNQFPNKRTFEDSNFKGKFRNVITGINSSQNKYRENNKATFPLYLPRIIMQNFGKKLDIWYDPFSGTGTTFHAAELEERHFIGTEIDIEQCELTNKRIWNEKSSLKLDFGDDYIQQENERLKDELKNVNRLPLNFDDEDRTENYW